MCRSIFPPQFNQQYSVSITPADVTTWSGTAVSSLESMLRRQGLRMRIYKVSSLLRCRICRLIHSSDEVLQQSQLRDCRWYHCGQCGCRPHGDEVPGIDRCGAVKLHFTAGFCDDGIDCTIDTCDFSTAECVFTPDATTCEDGLPYGTVMGLKDIFSPGRRSVRRRPGTETPVIFWKGSRIPRGVRATTGCCTLDTTCVWRVRAPRVPGILRGWR